ncbi:uncharacterized protein LOC143377982 [Andrena cerasifolii]|uniref:uncharacterized protein LOC143377982 n=1 Tax=Andrena cerasifolii TaxID=2819439 RepID=UPI00403768D1
MKLRTYYALCCLCALRALGAASEGSEISSEWRKRPVSNVSESLDSRESSARDKRALGLILSGLAQVFGYTVSPVQVATLSNGNTTSSDGGGTQQSANPEQTPSSSNSTQSTATSTTMAPRQRETIRFTGVVNFGNTSVLGHLQQYENIFHGASNASAPATTATPPTSTPLAVSPFLVNIPLPPMRQPPLPEIPSQDIRLSYPEPLIPTRREQQMMYRRNESTEKLIPENRELQGGKEAQSPPPPTPYTPFYSPYTVEPRWRKEYEDRLADLERKHEEHAERLRQQERYRNRVKDDGHKEGEMKMARGGEEPKCDENGHSNVDHLAEDDSRERSRYSSSPKEPQESEEKLRDYDNDDDYKSYKQYDDSPSANDTYSSVHYNEPLPINEDDEERRPEELRNSYGEPLNSRELVEEGFGNYFGKLKHTQSDFYVSPETPDSREDSNEEGEDSLVRDNGDEDESDGKEKKEYDLPATNKYEEYSLEEDTGTKGKNVENTEEKGSDPFVKYSNEAPFRNENRPNFEGRKPSEEVDFSKYMPLIVPFRYLAASEESKMARSRLSAIDKSDKVNNVADREGIKKLSSKESSRPKKENLKPKIGIPERPLPKRLHEGEQKELQMWPPPFDFVLDSTIQTGVAQKPRYTNGNPLAHRKAELPGKEEGKAPQRSGKRVSLVDSPAPRQRDYPRDIYYQRLKGGLDSRAASSMKAKSPRVAKPGVSNRTRSGDTRSHLQQRKRLPNVYSHRNVKGSNAETPRSMHSKRLEPLKRSAEKTGPIVRGHYSDGYLGGDQTKTDAQSQNGEDFPHASQELVPLMGFDSSRGVHDLLSFDKKDYRFSYGSNEMAGLRSIQDDETMQNGEKTGDLTMSQQNPYRYDERLAKYAGEPESKNEKAGQKEIDSSRSIGYVDLAHVL